MTFKNEVRIYLQDLTDGMSYESEDVIASALDHFKNKGGSKRFYEEVFPLFVATILNEERGRVRAEAYSKVFRDSENVASNVVNGIAKNGNSIAETMSKWRESNNLLMKMNRVQLLEAAANRTSKGYQTLRVAAFLKSLALQLSNETEVVEDRLSLDDVSSIYKTTMNGEGNNAKNSIGSKAKKEKSLIS